MLGFSACCRALFSVAQMLGFPHMLSISIPVSWPQKQFSVTKNPAPCDVARHQNSWTACCVVLLTDRHMWKIYLHQVVAEIEINQKEVKI